jgi:hypothetical protein
MDLFGCLEANSKGMGLERYEMSKASDFTIRWQCSTSFPDWQRVLYKGRPYEYVVRERTY